MHYVNTSTQLIFFLIFVVTLSTWGLDVLLGLMVLFVLLFAYLNNKHFYRLMYRLKWFYLVMFLIFAFNTSGQYVDSWPLMLKPTYEGLKIGSTQVLRIALVLAMLSLILTRNTKQQLISGLYYLMKPFACLGLDIQRFSARLWLTLHYVELENESGEKASSSLNLADKLEQAFLETEEDDLIIELTKPILSWVDYVVIIFSILFLLFAFLRRL